jgi:hypothetical protein
MTPLILFIILGAMVVLLVVVVLFLVLFQRSDSYLPPLFPHNSEDSCWPLTADSSTTTNLYFIAQLDGGYFTGYYPSGKTLSTDLTTPFEISPDGANWKCTITFGSSEPGISSNWMYMEFVNTNLETLSTCPDCLLNVYYMVEFGNNCSAHGNQVHYTNRLLNNIQMNYNRIKPSPSGSACSDYKTSWVLPASSTNYYSNCDGGSSAFGGAKASGDCWPLTCNSSDPTTMYFILQIENGYFSGFYDCFDNFIPWTNSSLPFILQPPNTTWKATITFQSSTVSSLTDVVMTFDPATPASVSTLKDVYFMVQFNNGVCQNQAGKPNDITFYNNTTLDIGIHYNRLAKEPQGNVCADYAHSWTLPAFAGGYFITCTGGFNDFSGSYQKNVMSCVPKTSTDSIPENMFAWIVMEHGGFSGFYQGANKYEFVSKDDPTVLTIQQDNWEVVFSPFNHNDNTCVVPNGMTMTIRPLSFLGIGTETPGPASPVSLKNMYMMFQYMSGTCGCTYAMIQIINQTSTNIIVNYNRLSSSPTVNACGNYEYQGVVNGNTTMYAFCDNATTAFGFLQENDSPCNLAESCWWDNLLKYTCLTMAAPFAEAEQMSACSTEWWGCEEICAGAMAADPELEAGCPAYCTALEKVCETTLEAGGVLTAEDMCESIGL